MRKLPIPIDIPLRTGQGAFAKAVRSSATDPLYGPYGRYYTVRYFQADGRHVMSVSSFDIDDLTRGIAQKQRTFPGLVVTGDWNDPTPPTD